MSQQTLLRSPRRGRRRMLKSMSEAPLVVGVFISPVEAPAVGVLSVGAPAVGVMSVEGPFVGVLLVVVPSVWVV